VTRFQKTAVATVIATVLLVTVGVIVRATGSGMGCPDWPLCYGQILPPLDDYKAWWEWIHRTIAAVIGFLILGVAFFAWKDHRDRPSILWPSLAAVALVVFQAWLGRETVRMNNSGESVTAHLAAAMTLLGLLIYVTVRAFYPAKLPARGGSQRFTLLAVLAAATMFVLLLFGSNVTAQDAGLVFPDWPLMNGSLIPLQSGMDEQVRGLYEAHALHRYVAGIVLVIVWVTAFAAWRTQRDRRAVFWMACAMGLIYPAQVVMGGLQVFTLLADWTQTLHVALSALLWGLSVALATTSYYESRLAAPAIPGDPAHGGDPTADDVTVTAPVAVPEPAADDATAPGPGADPSPSEAPAGAARAARVRAYIALTKPRIIELLLITTIPAMVLATRDLPGMNLGEWLRLAFWTMLAGTLAAGSANAINQYLDRDIDLLMTRTRRRPLPAHDVTPENALVFGIVLGIISIALMAFYVNLVSAFLTLLAIAFYVVVYTILLKRSTPQNIVIGGAAGALPPVIGWAAVTGSVEIPALFLFALVFYWTPPHFWALALRIRKDYEAARVPMLPVVKGVPETARQIALYTILLVAISILFWPVAAMGPIYLASAVVLGAIFLWRAFVLWQQATSPDGSLAQAIRLYKFSISYLTLLFAAVAVDALVIGTAG
jgi:protoheme IX farnesyltransferase